MECYMLLAELGFSRPCLYSHQAQKLICSLNHYESYTLEEQNHGCLKEKRAVTGRMVGVNKISSGRASNKGFLSTKMQTVQREKIEKMELRSINYGWAI